jgi:hypothetical protein
VFFHKLKRLSGTVCSVAPEGDRPRTCLPKIKTPISSVGLYTDVLTRIADGNLTKIDAILDETIWVMEEDVLHWLRSQVSCWKARRERDRAPASTAAVSRRRVALPMH